MGYRLRVIGLLLLLPIVVAANDTVYVSGGVQHGSLFPTTDASEMRSTPRASWAKIDHLSNSYVDLTLHYLNDSNKHHFKELRATTRLELMQWPLPGYDADFAGHGIGHLSVAATFDWGEITVGDVYGEFGSGLILNLYEERSLGVDGALRGAKCYVTPYKGIHLTALGGKQRRYWNCYKDGAWGWNYGRDAVLGADVELRVDQWSKRMQELDMSMAIGLSYVSKYEAFDTIIAPIDGALYMYNLPKWVGAGAVRAEWQWKGWNLMTEYARKANDPCLENAFSYRDGDAWLFSASYSRKGLSVLAQFKRSDNMTFRSARMSDGIAGRINHLPVFTQQHTYALAARYPYATLYATGEWAFQTEIRYTWARKTKMGGKYGTTLKLSASHIRGLAAPGSWAIDTSVEGEYYTDVNIEMNKRITKRFWLNAMLMYQTYNRQVIEGKGGIIRAGIAVLDGRVQVNSNVSIRGEAQYLYSRDYEGQWFMALCELNLYRRWTISGEWRYNIGYAPDANIEHYYTATLSYSKGAHRVTGGYTKTQEGFNCSGGVCRYVPKQEGVTISYAYNW